VLEAAPLVLCNVYALTEGVDVPEASCCIVARGCGHPGMWLQMAGRVLRPAPGKTHATVIDLRGVVHRHGLPEADRVWSLEGKAITVTAKEREEKLVVCTACSGAFSGWSVTEDGARCCPLCRALGAPMAAPEVKARRLHVMGSAAPPEVRHAELAKLAATAVAHGYKAGWASMRYREMFADWPPRGAGARAYAEAVAHVGEEAAREALERRDVARAERAARDALAAQAAADGTSESGDEDAEAWDRGAA
jgi:superfamily II DNA or RNA helicase